MTSKPARVNLSLVGCPIHSALCHIRAKSLVKYDSIFPKAPGLEPHHKIILCHILYTRWMGILPSCRDAVGRFHCLSQLDYKVIIIIMIIIIIHNWMGKVIHGEMCKKFKFDHASKWDMHHPAPVLENNTHKLLWDFHIQTDRPEDQAL